MPEMIRYDYQDGLEFYEKFRPSLVAQAGTSRAYATGVAIIDNSGLLHFLDKFKRKGPISPRSAYPSAEGRSHYELPDSDTKELIYVLAGMMRSSGKLYGASKHKDNP